MLALALGANQAAAADDGDDDDDDDALVLITGPVDIRPGDTLENLFTVLSRMDAPDAPCTGTVPLLAQPLPAPGSYACGILVNAHDTSGIWRIDFEESLGAGYVFDIRRTTQTTRVLTNSVAAGISQRETGGLRLASLPIALAPGERITVRVRIDTPADLLDADPLLRPELSFDRSVANRAHGFGALIGASLVLLVFFLAFARLLRSAPARAYAAYFAVTTLVAAANEGYVAHLIPVTTDTINGLFNSGLGMAQIALHLLFVAAFVTQALPGHPLPRKLRRLAVAAVGVLAAASALAYLLGGRGGWLRYLDLGLELDPLLEEPSLPLLMAALVSVMWMTALIYAALVLGRARVKGASLFMAGALILMLSIVLNSFSDLIFDDFDDDHFWLQYVLLFDGLLFAAAIVRQAFGLRDERDAAMAQELAAVQEKARISEALLETRADRDRAQTRAEAHRSRLALAGHDLRQPLTSLRLAIEDADKSNPALGDTLRLNLSYLKELLDTTLADSMPDEIAPSGHAPLGMGLEDVPLALIFSNAVNMFSAEAAAKGLALSHLPTDLSVRTEPIALIRTVSNLTSNAVKYTTTGQVTLAAVATGDTIAIEVRDTGPGLTPEEIAQITQSYRRGAQAGAAEGTGLGLSSVQVQAAQMGLSFEIESTPGAGSVFRLGGLRP